MGFVAQRVSSGLVTLIIMTFVIFCLQSVVPIDPARLIAGPAAPAATVDAIRTELGLDEDLFTRYSQFLARLTRGDLGQSIRTRQPVLSDIARHLPATLELAAVAMILGTLMATVLAVIQASYPVARFLRLLLVGLGSAPIYLTALSAVYVFWFRLGWLPGSGRLSVRISDPTGIYLIDSALSGEPKLFFDAVAHLILPASVLALPIVVGIGQALTSSLYDVMKQGYVRTAHGKGLPSTLVIVRHGLRNAANGALTMSGLQVRLLFGNILIVERVFGWPGLGMYMVQSLAYSDLPAILGVTLLLGTLYITVWTVVEIAQQIADPRISAIRD
ncbi:ABC transporter permease [Endobacterium cereale]|uniref:ABC transporter permease n=1 Tax=Endobacterium cereale TaxID=2663029 RepID=UPI002B473885|nr:ABC transporter permease [Endobacterium cereale]MEB2848059.1 ABC transporter permease [Endobacterium cereale]